MSSSTSDLSASRVSRQWVPSQTAPRLSVLVRRGAAWNALSTLLLRLVNIIVTAVVAHILAPRDFGVFAVALTVYTIVLNISEFGVASCLVRADLNINVMAPTMFTVSLVTSGMAAGVMAEFARPIATALGSANGAQAIRV